MTQLNRSADFRDPASKLRSLSLPGKLCVVLFAIVFLYGGYFWFVRRVVVSSDEVMILLKKDGSRSLPEGEFVIPAAPDQKTNPSGYAAWEKQYGDCNGVMEQVYLPGVYFGFSPWDYERDVLKLSDVSANVPANKVGIVIKKFGSAL